MYGAVHVRFAGCPAPGQVWGRGGQCPMGTGGALYQSSRVQTSTIVGVQIVPSASQRCPKLWYWDVPWPPHGTCLGEPGDQMGHVTDSLGTTEAELPRYWLIGGDRGSGMGAKLNTFFMCLYRIYEAPASSLEATALKVES
jgi:hypothetical protein